MPRSAFSRRGPTRSWRARGSAKGTRKRWSRSAGTLGRKRTRFSFKRQWKRGFAKRRRYGFSKKRILTHVVNSIEALNTQNIVYQDEVIAAQALNDQAYQKMWINNQTVSGNAGSLVTQNLAVNSLNNLHLMDPAIIRKCFDARPTGAGALANAPQKIKMFIHSYSVNVDIVNTGTNTFTLTEYRVKARNAVPTQGAGLQNFVTNGSQGAGVDQLADPNITWEQWGAQPYDLPLFVKNFKIIKQKAWRLRPGDHQKLAYRIRKQRFVNHEDYYMQASGAGTWALATCRKGDTMSLFRIQPDWAGTTNALSMTGMTLGAGSCFCGMIYQTRVKYRAVTPAQDTTAAFRYMGGLVAGALPGPVINTHNVANAAGKGDGAGYQDQDLDV